MSAVGPELSKKPIPSRKRHKPVGRPTLCTEEMIQKICGLLRQGNYFDVACRSFGINPTTALEWIARGEGRSDMPSAPHFVKFSEEVRKAVAVAEPLLINEIQRAAKNGQWTAAAFILERKFPNRWGRKDQKLVRHEHEQLPSPVRATPEDPDALLPEDAVARIDRAKEMLEYARLRAAKLIGPGK